MVRQQDVCVCPASHTKGQRLLPGWGWGGWYRSSPGTMQQCAYGSSLCVLSKVRGLELPPRNQGSLWVYAFHPCRSLVLVLVRLISELEFIPFKLTSYSLFPRWMVNLIFRAFEKRAYVAFLPLHYSVSDFPSQGTFFFFSTQSFTIDTLSYHVNLVSSYISFAGDTEHLVIIHFIALPYLWKLSLDICVHETTGLMA